MSNELDRSNEIEPKTVEPMKRIELSTCCLRNIEPPDSNEPTKQVDTATKQTEMPGSEEVVPNSQLGTGKPDYPGYGSIPHLPGSRRGPGDRGVNEGVLRMVTVPQKGDSVYVQEKLDGSNVSILRQGSRLVTLQRKGWPCTSSPFELHHRFDAWVQKRASRFFDLLKDGERLSGEWLALAHGTIYEYVSEPFVSFDLWTVDGLRSPYLSMMERVCALDVYMHNPFTISLLGPLSIDEAMSSMKWSFEPEGGVGEGVVYRVERGGKVIQLCKFVRPEKVDGKYLKGIGSEEDVWLWTDNEGMPLPAAPVQEVGE